MEVLSTVVKQNDKTAYDYKEIYIDKASEKDSIDKNNICPGSILYVIETGDVYMLSNKKEWILQ